MDIISEIRTNLYRMQDREYRAFQSKLIPAVDPDHFIGVRTPALRKFAKQISRRNEIDVFLKNVPHDYFDENQLHAFIISELKDYAECLDQVCRFLPYIDNWATCDQLNPNVFRSHKAELIQSVRTWIDSDRTYTVRFGLKMLMDHFLDDEFDPAYLKLASAIRSEEYYIRMMNAWYFSTALAKQYEAALPYIEEHRLEPWTNNRTIQKAVESRRITPEQKAYLRSFKVK